MSAKQNKHFHGNNVGHKKGQTVVIGISLHCFVDVGYLMFVYNVVWCGLQKWAIPYIADFGLCSCYGQLLAW